MVQKFIGEGVLVTKALLAVLNLESKLDSVLGEYRTLEFQESLKTVVHHIRSSENCSMFSSNLLALTFLTLGSD